MKSTFFKPAFLVGLLLLLFIFPEFAQNQIPASSDAQYTLIKPSTGPDGKGSGDKQYEDAGAQLPLPLRVRVVDQQGQAVPGITVLFTILAQPSDAEGTMIERSLVTSDQSGYAATNVTLGSAPGRYDLAASFHQGTAGENFLLFHLTARKANWVFFLVIALAGGLGLFLFGMEMMSNGMKKTAGNRLRSILSRLTHNRFIALAVGAFVTMIIQSSSATTVMLVSFVQAQLMTFTQSFGIILGAHIGTTFTAQLIAFKLTDYALLMVAVGIAMSMLGKKPLIQNIGETLFGFGLLFFGMKVMSEAMYPLRTYAPFIALLVELENPVLGIIVGTIFTALIQSSSAFTGILIVLAIQGLLTLEAGIPLILGANIGTCITAGLAAVNGSRDAKRVALAHTLFQVVGVLIFVWWIPWFAEIVRWLSPKSMVSVNDAAYLAQVVPRQLANAHTVFNVAAALLMLPFLGWAAKIVVRILPDKEEVEEEFYTPRYLDDALLTTPVLALSLAKAEVIRMGEIAKEMVSKAILPFMDRNRDVLAELKESEEEVDFLEEKISSYLTRISQKSMSEDKAEEAFQMMYAVTEFEQIADIVTKNLHPRALEWLGSNHKFSEQGRNEINDFHVSALKQISRAIDSFRDSDLKKAKKMKRKFRKYRSMSEDLMRTHYERLRKGIPESKATTEFHIDLMEQFRRINSHATNIARILLEWTPETPLEIDEKSNA